MAYIELKNISKTYLMGEMRIAALKDVSFSVNRGELVCILGPSGAGKTTCLNILGGMDDATSGVLTVDGLAIAALEGVEAAEAELDGIDMPTWYLYDRTGYSTYNDDIDDANSLRNLATLFPIVFFAVAVLVSLISMNRMVEENRLEIGTMKSMGFPASV